MEQSRIERSQYHFKPAVLPDIVQLLPYFQRVENRFCDFNAAALFLWADYYDTHFCIIDDVAVFRGRMEDGRVMFTVINHSAHTARTVEALYRYALEAYGYFILFPVAEEERAYYSAMLPGASCRTIEAENQFDYLYLADDLIGLAGKRYHGQRNHISRFLRECQGRYEVLPLTTPVALEAADFVAKLARETDAGAHPMRLYENQKSEQLLRRFAELPCMGMAVRADGRIAAVTAGSVRGDTLYVHIEKADRSIEGSYAFINNAFAAHVKQHYPEVVYINREDDLGDPGLRRAKESYHPVKLLRRYILYYQ